MKCPRCIGGLLHFEQLEWGDPYTAKCLNCGARPGNVPYDEPIREPFQRKRCRNCQKPPVSERNYCQSCSDYRKNYKRKVQA